MSELYLTVNSDGNNTEGIGSIVQYQLLLYSLCKSLNLKYAFLGFKNLQHYQNFKDYTQSTWCDRVNCFFNFPNELIGDDYIVIKMGLNEFLNYYNSNPKINKNTVIDIIQWDLLNLDVNLYYKFIFNLSDRIRHNIILDPNKFNISLHIRCRTELDMCIEPTLNLNREFFDKTSLNYYKNLIKNVDAIHSEKQKIYHIHTQLKCDEIKFLQDNISSEFVYYINDYPWNSLSCMIQSDVFIGANSSFSYIAHLLNKNKCLFRNNMNNLYKSTILLDNGGNF